MRGLEMMTDAEIEAFIAAGAKPDPIRFTEGGAFECADNFDDKRGTARQIEGARAELARRKGYS
jgi:hypothetical protein